MPVKSLQLRKVADKAGKEPPRNTPVDGVLPNPDLPAGALLEPWPLKHVELMAPAPKRHEFADDFVMHAASEGWLTLGSGNITIHLLDKDLVYKIMRLPGRYKDGKPTELVNDPTVDVYHSYDAKLVEA